MKKLILTFFLLLTVISFAEIVYITPTGKQKPKVINLANIPMEDNLMSKARKIYEPYFFIFFLYHRENQFPEIHFLNFQLPH